MGDDGTRVPAPRVRAVGRSPSLARTVDAALLAPGTPTLLTLVGPSGADVAVALDQLVLPAAHEHAASDRVRTATGLAWERGRAGGVLERLRLPADDPDDLAGALASLAPVAIVVGEAQDADAHSLHLLSSAVHRLGPARVLVVVAATADRVEADSGALAELHRAHRGTSYAVEALDIAGVHELAAHAGVPLDESAARRLWRHTEGSPGLIAEILVQSDPQHWARLDARIPAARSAARAARAALAAADPEVRALVECCAVLGRWGTLAELRALSGLDDVLGPLDRAEASGLLQVRPGLRPLIGFPTRMARAAAYEATGVLRRHALHTRAAATLESPGEVLQHRCMAVLAPDPTLADDLVRHAADCAGRGSWRQAGQALLAAHRLATDPVVAEDCLIRSVDALVSAGDIVDAAALARRPRRTPSCGRTRSWRRPVGTPPARPGWPPSGDASSSRPATSPPGGGPSRGRWRPSRASRCPCSGPGSCTATARRCVAPASAGTPRTSSVSRGRGSPPWAPRRTSRAATVNSRPAPAPGAWR